MKINRRVFLTGSGALTILVVGGGVWRAHDQGVFRIGQGPAYEPWKNWRTDEGHGPLALVRAGILAANPHNTQPWLFKVTNERIELYADIIRNLGTFDPYLREMHIGLGCAVENMVVAANANGYEAQVTLSEGVLGPLPANPELTLVASINFSPGQREQNKLYEAIPLRHTNRGAYDPQRMLSPEAITTIRQLANNDSDIALFLFASEPDKAKFADAVVKATEAIIADAAMVQDSERWFRYGKDNIQKFRDGPTLDAAGMSPLITTLAKMLPPPSADTNQKYWLDATQDTHVATSPVFGLIAVRDRYDRAQSLRVGRVWQRIHLWATSQGIAMQPLNQPVEMVDRERQLNREPKAEQVLLELTRDPAWKPTFAFRAGYPMREASASPRRSVEQVIASGIA